MLHDRRRAVLPASVHPKAETICSHAGIRARVMFAKMMERAESGSDHAYSDAMRRWLDGKASTIVLRDELCAPFKSIFPDRGAPWSPELDWFNAFADLDTAHCHTSSVSSHQHITKESDRG